MSSLLVAECSTARIRDTMRPYVCVIAVCARVRKLCDEHKLNDMMIAMARDQRMGWMMMKKSREQQQQQQIILCIIIIDD